MDGETLKERIARLEQLLGDWFSEDIATAWGNYIQNEAEVQHNLAKQHEEFIRGRVTNVHYEILALKENFGSKLQSLSKDVTVLKKAISQGASPATDGPLKVRVPEPKGLSGN